MQKSGLTVIHSVIQIFLQYKLILYSCIFNSILLFHTVIWCRIWFEIFFYKSLVNYKESAKYNTELNIKFWSKKTKTVFRKTYSNNFRFVYNIFFFFFVQWNTLSWLKTGLNRWKIIIIIIKISVYIQYVESYNTIFNNNHDDNNNSNKNVYII